MKRLFIGPCPVCNTQIWEDKTVIVDGREYKKQVLNEKGTHFWILSNYKSVMKIAICKDCLQGLTDLIVARIIADIVWTWSCEVNEDKDLSEEKKFARFTEARFYMALKWGQSEEEVKNAG